MIPPGLADCLIAAHVRLARTLPGTEVWEFPGGAAACGPFRHPLANFCFLGPEADYDLASLAAKIDGPWFCVYALEPLVRARELPGFQVDQEMAVLTADAPEIDPEPLRFASQPKERLAIARFMTRQFYTNLDPGLSDRLASTTARGENLELAAFQGWVPGRIEAAVMLSCTPGWTGVFNVCVDARLRGKGKGSTIMRRVLAHAAGSGNPLVLQCEARLVPWYRRFGFREIGRVRMFSVSS